MPKAINSFQMWGELFAIFIGRCYSTVLWQESFDLLVTTCLKKGKRLFGPDRPFFTLSWRLSTFVYLRNYSQIVFNQIVDTEGDFQERGTEYHSEALQGVIW